MGESTDIPSSVPMPPPLLTKAGKAKAPGSTRLSYVQKAISAQEESAAKGTKAHPMTQKQVAEWKSYDIPTSMEYEHLSVDTSSLPAGISLEENRPLRPSVVPHIAKQMKRVNLPLEKRLYHM